MPYFKQDIQSISAGTTRATSGEVIFSNANSMSFGIDGQTVTGSFSTSQSNQQMTLFATSNTTQSSTGTTNASSIIFAGAGVASVGITNGSVVISVPAGGGGLTNVNLSAGTTSQNLSNFVFSNSNNVSFGLDGSTVTATVTIATSLTNINMSAGTKSNNLSNIVFSNSNRVSFGLNGSTITAQHALNFSAGTTSNNISDQIVFSNSNNIIFGNNASTITAELKHISSYENILGFGTSTFTQSMAPGSISIAVAFNLPQPISASFIRIPMLLTANSTTLSTAAASLSGSADVYTTFNAVVYSLGVGANSRSLQSVASGSRGWTMRNSISVGADGTSGSYSQFLTVGAAGNDTVFTTQTTIANTNYSFVSASLTAFTGSRFLDINFANSLSAGPYWLIFGMTTNSASNSARISAATNCRIGYASHQVAGQWNVNFGIMGSTNLTSGGALGVGSFSTAGGGTTASLPISAISSSASNIRPYFQILRSA